MSLLLPLYQSGNETEPFSDAVSIKETSGQQHVNQWIRAHFWFAVYADPFTCDKDAPVEDEVVEYEMVFLNPDSSGHATDHFGDDLRGQVITLGLESLNRANCYVFIQQNQNMFSCSFSI